MGLFENFPYANFHELNLDWILKKLKELETEITNFVAINSVKYANPITWDITSQYETNTVVLDSSGNAYLSVQPVPAGVDLDREEYWTKIGNFSALWDSVRSAITPYDEQHSTTASIDHKPGDWVWLENDLLLITKNITAGDKYVEGSNCQKTNLHDLFTAMSDDLKDEITARENADNTLDGKITAEAQARAAADEKLTDDIAKTGSITNFKAFGAVGDGVADDTQAIKDCLSYAAENKKAIMGNFGTYKITDTIDINGQTIRYCHCEGTLNPAFNDKPAVIIHQAGNYQKGPGDYEFHVIGETVNGGYNFIGITDFNTPELPFKGICVQNCYHSNFVLTARNCHIGISVEATDAGGNGGGSAYNTFNIPDVGDNAVSLDLMSKDQGWVNENLFLGVSVQDYVPNPGAGKTIGIRLWCNNSTMGLNNNVFVKPCLQCAGLPVLLNDADLNQFIGTRCESTSRPADIDYYIMCKGVSKNNLFQTLYASDSKFYKDALSEANNYGNNAFQTGLAPKRKIFGWVYDKTKVIKYSNALIVNELDNYCPYVDTTSGQPEYAYGDFSDAGITTSDHNHIGRYFDVSEYPNITVCAHAAGDFYLGVFLFDADFNYINANENDVNNTNGTRSYSTMYIQDIGSKKYARTSAPANGEIYTFNIANKNAKYAFIGANGNNITSLEFYNYEGSFLYKIKSNILPKRMVDIDGLKIPSSTGLKVANVGQFVRDNSGTISTESDGSYITLGYVRTGGTDDAQEFKTVKAKAV